MKTRIYYYVKPFFLFNPAISSNSERLKSFLIEADKKFPYLKIREKQKRRDS
jgi:hypothetical protein